MDHKGYECRLIVDSEDGVITGKVISIEKVIKFQSESAKDTGKELRKSIEDYLDFCSETGEEPEKPFSGTLLLKIPPELHKRALISANAENLSLNVWLTKCIENRLNKKLKWPIWKP
jgi:predicted HicB family RNase H-like nuclease